MAFKKVPSKKKQIETLTNLLQRAIGERDAYFQAAQRYGQAYHQIMAFIDDGRTSTRGAKVTLYRIYGYLDGLVPEYRKAKEAKKAEALAAKQASALQKTATKEDGNAKSKPSDEAVTPGEIKG